MNRDASFIHSLRAFLASARLAAALSLSAISLGIFAFALHNTISWAGFFGMMATLIVLCAASLFARRDSIEWTSLMPISLLAFLAWATASIFWSQHQWATFGGLAYLAGFTFLGLYVALVRDTIQIIRDFGDVLRFMLVLSLALEVFSGLLIDMPIPFLGISGNLEHGGAISGLTGNRNELGLLAVIGAISFTMEWRTRSVDRVVAGGSLMLAAVALILTRSPIAWGTAVVAVSAMAVLYGIRRIPAERRTFWLLGALVLAAVAAVAAWLLRTPIVAALNAGGELQYRLELWGRMWSLIPLHPIEGWGWIGLWQEQLLPFPLLNVSAARPATSAVNAYLDVWFQLGAVGLVLFLLLVGLAFVRSWLLAARKRSVIFTWPATALAALLVASLAESSILFEFGWLTFVICCVKASQSLSWRTAFQRPLEQDPL